MCHSDTNDSRGGCVLAFSVKASDAAAMKITTEFEITDDEERAHLVVLLQAMRCVCITTFVHLPEPGFIPCVVLQAHGGDNVTGAGPELCWHGSPLPSHPAFLSCPSGNPCIPRSEHPVPTSPTRTERAAGVPMHQCIAPASLPTSIEGPELGFQRAQHQSRLGPSMTSCCHTKWVCQRAADALRGRLAPCYSMSHGAVALSQCIRRWRPSGSPT